MEREPLSRASTVGHLARSPESIMGMMLRAPGATMASIVTGVSHEAERHVNPPSSCGAGKLVVHRKLKKKQKESWCRSSLALSQIKKTNKHDISGELETLASGQHCK